MSAATVFTARDYLVIAVIVGLLAVAVWLKAGPDFSVTVAAGEVVQKREAITMPLDDTWRHEFEIGYTYQPRDQRHPRTATARPRSSASLRWNKAIRVSREWDEPAKEVGEELGRKSGAVKEDPFPWSPPGTPRECLVQQQEGVGRRSCPGLDLTINIHSFAAAHHLLLEGLDETDRLIAAIAVDDNLRSGRCGRQVWGKGVGWPRHSHASCANDGRGGGTRA